MWAKSKGFVSDGTITEVDEVVFFCLLFSCLNTLRQ